MAAGDVAAYLLGSAVEYEWGSQVSLIVFLALYFLFLWGRMGTCRLGYQAKISRAGTVLIFTPQIRSALGQLGRFASKSGPASPRGFFFTER
jgi:hypothetical protein